MLVQLYEEHVHLQIKERLSSSNENITFETKKDNPCIYKTKIYSCFYNFAFPNNFNSLSLEENDRCCKHGTK